MAGRVLRRRPRVEDDDPLRPSSFQQLVHLHGLGVRALAEMLADQPVQVRQLMFSDGSDRRAEAEHGGVREAIRDEQAVLSTLNQGGLSKRLKMLRGIGERKTDFGRQGVNGPFPLSEQLQNLEPMRTGERLANTGELPVQAVLELAVSITCHSQVTNRLLDYNLSSLARHASFGEERGNRVPVSSVGWPVACH